MAEVLPYVRAVALTVALGLGGGAVVGCGAETDLGNREAAAAAAADVDAGAPTEEETAACAETFAMPGLPRNERSRVVLEGIPQLANATNEDEAREAIGVWSDVITRDDGVLAGYARQILGKEVPKAELVDGDGCATELADDLRTNMEIALAEGEISDGSVPAPDGTLNTGFNGEDVVVAERAGVSGDTMGISVKLLDGTIFHFLGRCGNLGIVKAPVYLPPGDTDEPPKTPSVTPPKVPAKESDRVIPGNPKVPADQDDGTPDRPGVERPGTPRPADGYHPTDSRPVAPTTTRVESSPPTTEGRPPASTTPPPPSTNPPVGVTAPPTTAREDRPLPTTP